MNKKFLSMALVLLWSAMLSLSEKVDWKFCDDFEKQQVAIDKFEMTPLPLIGGKEATASISGTLNTEIQEGAYVEGTAKYLFISVPIDRQDLCRHLLCPLKPGNFTATETFDIPDQYPPGEYQVNIKGYQKNGSPLFCMEATIDMS